MKLNRRSLLGFFFAAPLIRGVKLPVLPARPPTFRINGDDNDISKLLICQNIDDQLSVAEFVAPIGRFSLGQSIEIRFNRDTVFAGYIISKHIRQDGNEFIQCKRRLDAPSFLYGRF
jgi:hypothetical protein